MKNFNNSLLNIVSPSPSAIATGNSNKNNFCLMPNLPVPTVGTGTLLPSNSIDNLSVSSAAASNSMGSILLGNNNATKSTSAVAAMVAAAAAAANFNNNKGIQRQPSATVVSSSQLMVAHSNGASDGGGAMLLGGSHRHQRLPLNPTTYQSQQSSSTHHMTTANAIAVAIAAAAATAAQQQHPYRHQHHYQTSTASAASMTSFLPLNAFRTKKQLLSKTQTNIRESVVPSAIKQSSAAVRNCTATTIEACTTATSSIPSILVPSSEDGTDTTVCTLAATVGATSAIATLASPVPSVMLLSTSSTSSSSNSSSHNDTIGMNNFSHRSTADDLSPSSSSSKVGGGFNSSMSTMLMPMNTKTQSNEPYISNNGSSDGDLPHTSDFSNAGYGATATAVDGSTEIAATMNVEHDSRSFIPEDAIADVCTNNDEENSSVTTRLCTSRTFLKHKLNFNDDVHDPSVTTKPAKVRLTEYAMIASTETNEPMVGVAESGMSEQQKDDAVRASSLCTTNGASEGHSPPTEDSPIERCKNNRL